MFTLTYKLLAVVHCAGYPHLIACVGTGKADRIQAVAALKTSQLDILIRGRNQ